MDDVLLEMQHCHESRRAGPSLYEVKVVEVTV
jgi:hypothetical protein